MSELAVATLDTDLPGALSLGSSALGFAEREGVPLLLSARCTTEALVLGALQHPDTLPKRSPARFDGSVLCRRTTGTEAQLRGDVLYHALALPRVDALFPDASARTLLNRNLRALLRGYAGAGIPLRYFGTEVLALHSRPVALVGYDQSPTGAVLIEVLVGLAEPCVVRPAVRREPASSLFGALGRELPPGDLLRSVVAEVLAALGRTPRDVAASLPPAELPPAVPRSLPTVTLPIPLGALEACVDPAPSLTGDLLVSRAALDAVLALAASALERGEALTEAVLAPLVGAPLDGARPPDVLRALMQAAEASPSHG